MSFFSLTYCTVVLYGYVNILIFLARAFYQPRMVFGRLFQKIKDLQERIKALVLKSLSLVLVTSLLVAGSSLLYIIIYHVTIPDIATTHPLNFLFKSNCGTKRCDYPKAIIDLQEGKFNFNFKRGEEYEVIVDLIAPETPVNHNVGMFVLNVGFESEKIVRKVKGFSDIVFEPERVTFREDRKSTMMRYKSPLVKALFSIFYSPLLVSGFWEDSQIISTKVVLDYEVVADYPLLAIRVTLESGTLDIYEAQLTVQAKLSGFRYYMYHYPVSSFFVGVPILFPLIILILSAKVYCLPFTKQRKLLASSFSKFSKQSSPKRETPEVLSKEKKPLCGRVEEREVKHLDIEFTPSKEIQNTDNLDSPSSGNGSSLKTSSIEKSIEIESLSLSSLSDELSFADDDDEGSIEVLGTPDTPTDLLRSKTPTETEESGKSSTEEESEDKSSDSEKFS